MNNLFIVNTPFQLLVAYMLAHSQQSSGTQNHLLLMKPHAFEKWSTAHSLNFIIHDREIWREFSHFEDWLNRKVSFSDFKVQVRDMQEALNKMSGYDCVYLGSDRGQNQLIVALTGKETFNRFDEGIGSYYSIHKPNYGRKYWHLLRLKFIMALGGIKSKLPLNVGGIGMSKAGQADYLIKPELLQRPSPNPIQIEKDWIDGALAKISQGSTLSSDLNSENCILFLSSPNVEMRYCTAETELEILKTLYNQANKMGMKFLYKPHPAENYTKLEAYRKQLPGVIFFQCVDPVEYLYYIHTRLKYVLSYLSSGLLHSDVFSSTETVAISLVKLYGREREERVYVDIMKKAGVYVPDTVEQVVGLLQ